MDERAEDALTVARDRLERIEARQRALEAERASVPAPAGLSDDAVSETLCARARRLECERARAYNAVGRALLDKYERDMAAMRVPMRSRSSAYELAFRANEIYRSCLAIMTQWPDLQDEARQRLHPPTIGDLFTLHG